jgi:hypothetical protein
VEQSLGRLKGRPLSLTPMYVQRDDHATGLIRLLSIALRVLTLLGFVGRRQLATEGAQLAGLYAGNTKRDTARPTAERLLEAFREITLTIVAGAHVSVNSFLDTLGPKIMRPQPRHTVAPVAPGPGLCSHAGRSARSYCIDAGTRGAPGAALPPYQTS